jgi:hypothetical protein
MNIFFLFIIIVILFIIVNLLLNNKSFEFFEIIRDNLPCIEEEEAGNYEICNGLLCGIKMIFVE